jgi:ribosomal protein S27AE
MKQWYSDVETCGFHGVPVLMQYAIDDGPVVLHEIWRRPVGETLSLIEQMMQHEVVGFNLAFDHFHIQKIYNILKLFARRYNADLIPQDYIEEIASLEMEARDGDCVKPASALDLMLYFKKTEMQVTMQRDDVRIRRVPRVLAEDLAAILTKKIKLDPILFEAQKKWAPRFQIEEIEDKETGLPHPSLCNIVLRFKPSGSLKALATHLLKVKIARYTEIEIDKKFRPKELGYAPFAEALGQPGRWNWTWPDVLKYHISHWAYREDARKYAANDIEYTRGLHKLVGGLRGGDTNSILSCMVASCRWKGYRVDVPKLEALVKVYTEQLKAPMAPSHVKRWINEVIEPIERLAFWKSGTSKKALNEIIAEWGELRPEAVERARAVLKARAAKKKIEILEKLIKAGRFHASVKVSGALTDRMSGDNGLNAQGIDKTKEVRECFPFAFDGEELYGGDMMSFEIGIAVADYGDPELRRLMTTCESCNLIMVLDNDRYRCEKCKGTEAKSFHALFGMGFFPELGYDGIMATKGLKVGNVYNPCKNSAFATLYGAQPAKIAVTMGIPEEQAIEGFHKFWRTFEVAGARRREVEHRFTSLYSDGVGSKIEYKKPDDYIESMLGHRRYFTLENYLIKELYEIANNVPKEWTKLKFKVTRSRKGEQSVSGAIRSAVYGCAFGLQNSCIRQAANHRIQSTGAGITKEIQVKIWGLQPSGINAWRVRPLNIHDEIQCPTDPSCVQQLNQVVYETVESFRPIIPLIGIDWGKLNSWADK